MGDKRGIAYNLNNSGNIHLSRGDYEEAFKSFKESLTIAREIGDKRTMAYILKNTGFAHN
jgi:hypothetical protein